MVQLQASKQRAHLAGLEASLDQGDRVGVEQRALEIPACVQLLRVDLAPEKLVSQPGQAVGQQNIEVGEVAGLDGPAAAKPLSHLLQLAVVEIVRVQPVLLASNDLAKERVDVAGIGPKRPELALPVERWDEAHGRDPRPVDLKPLRLAQMLDPLSDRVPDLVRAGRGGGRRTDRRNKKSE